MSVLRVKQPYAVGHRIFRAGDLLDENDPAVKGREQFLEPTEETVTRRQTVERGASVEQATAAPGEKRSVSRRKPKA